MTQESKKGRNIYIFLIMFIFCMSLISALDEFPSKKTGIEFNFTQTCSDATYVTLSSIETPSGRETINQNLTYAGSGDFYYPYTANQDGDYDFRGISDGCTKTFVTTVPITPSGNSGTSNIVFFVFIIILLYALNLVAFFGKNIPLTILSGMALIFLGVYMINNGVIVYQDNLTNYLAYVTIALGAITASWAALEQLEIL